MTIHRSIRVALAGLAISIAPGFLAAQERERPIATSTTTSTPLPAAGPERLDPGYVLGPGDQVLFIATDVPEISNRPFRVDGDGFIDVPMIGRIKTADL